MTQRNVKEEKNTHKEMAKKEIHNKGFGWSLCLMPWDYEFSSFSLNEVFNCVSLAVDIAAIHFDHCEHCIGCTFKSSQHPAAAPFVAKIGGTLSHLHPNNRH